MSIRERIRSIVNEACLQAIENGDLQRNSVEYPAVKIEYPKEEKFGDFSTSFALETARILKRSPIDIANILTKYIVASEIEKVEVVKPGFTNIFLSMEYLCKNMLNVINEGENYGKTKKDSPKKINIEFVSANPTGPMNIVSARAAAAGDTLANLFESAGDIVDREFYVNDYGNQVRLLGLSVMCRYRELNGEKVAFPEDGYHGEYIKDIARYCKDKFDKDIQNIHEEENLIEFFSVKAIEYNVSGQKSDLDRFNVRFKSWFSERSLHEAGAVQKTLLDLESGGYIYEQDSKKIFRSTDFGDDKDRVVVREDGRPTYLLADIAYHKNKLDRGYDRIIDIWGPDHHGYIARMKGAMKALGCSDEKFGILISQQVNLLLDGEQVKMSKRLGRFSTMKELIDDIGIDVARYFFIMRSLESHLDFDLDLAKRESSENPVFYLQYAHARICSIFREAEKREIKYNTDNINNQELNNPEAVYLLKLLSKFPEEIIDAAFYYEPHRIPAYLLRLAQGFHRFYTEHRILSDNIKTTSSNLALCTAIKIILKNGLNLLGVSAPEKM